ncbi:MAG: hypothetical protein WA667_15355 [Candidatus Nitrosopolaris sp.]
MSSVSKPIYYDNPEGTKGMWQMVKCRNCTKKWKVSWDEEYVIDFGDKVFILECTTCGYQIRIKNPNAGIPKAANHPALYRSL